MVKIVDITDEQDKKQYNQGNKQKHEEILELQFDAFQFAKFWNDK